MCEFVHSHPSMWHEQRTKWKQCTSLSRANFFSPNNQQTPCLLLIAAARARFTHQSSYMFMCVIQWATSRLSEAHLVQTSRECAKRSLTSHGCFAANVSLELNTIQLLWIIRCEFVTSKFDTLLHSQKVWTGLKGAIWESDTIQGVY